MADLVPRPAWAGLDLPLALGGATLAALPDAPLFSLAPFRGGAEAIAVALGAPLPAQGQMTELADGGRLIWSGLDQWLLSGASPDPALADHAAITDQTDGWTALALRGAGAADVLARLVPLDLDPRAFPPGAVARTQLGHMACVLIRAAAGFEIHVMRSFTRTAVHEIETAMRSLVARSRTA